MNSYDQLITRHPNLILELNRDVVRIREALQARGVQFEGLPTLIYLANEETKRATPVSDTNTIPIIVDGQQGILGEQKFMSVSSVRIHPKTITNLASLTEDRMSLKELLAEIPKTLSTLKPFNRRHLRQISAQTAIDILYTLTQSERPSPELVHQIMRSAQIE